MLLKQDLDDVVRWRRHHVIIVEQLSSSLPRSVAHLVQPTRGSSTRHIAMRCLSVGLFVCSPRISEITPSNLTKYSVHFDCGRRSYVLLWRNCDALCRHTSVFADTSYFIQWAIWRVMSICQFVNCLFVSLSACITREPQGRSSPIFCACCLWPWLGPPLTVFR